MQSTLSKVTQNLIPFNHQCEIYPDRTNTGWALLVFDKLSPEALQLIPEEHRERIRTISKDKQGLNWYSPESSRTNYNKAPGHKAG